jgi:P-type Ca2+ transporter type 2C
VSLFPVVTVFLATQLPNLQKGMLTQPLTGPQWLAAIGLALALPLVIEGSKLIRRHRASHVTVLDVQDAVTPARGREPA